MKTMTVVALAVLACACVIRNENTNEQAQGISGASAASPDPQCSVVSVDLGTDGDVTELPAGGDPVALIVSVFGSQGLELPASCRDRLTPVITVTAPCLLGGGGFTANVRAPEGSNGASCVATATVAGHSDSVSFTVPL